MDKNWRISPGTEEQQKLAGAVVEFFVDLGNKAIDAKGNGTDLRDNPFPSHIKIITMRDIGFDLDNLKCSFNSGDESVVAQKLFGKSGMSYQRFFEKVYEEICNTIGEPYMYTPHKSTARLQELGVI